VWALDSSNGIHAREAVYPELPVGTSWVLVSGLTAKTIAVTKDNVWVLSTSDVIYRRLGLSSTNWVGDSWQVIPSPERKVSAFGVTQCDLALVFDMTGIMFQLNELGVANHEIHKEIEGDWTLVN